MLYFFNTTIAPTAGLTYTTRAISLIEAVGLVDDTCRSAGLPDAAGGNLAAVGIQSAIGHEATASIMSTLLNRHIPVDRHAAVMQAGDRAICLKLRGRPQEGVVLSREEVEAIGYDLVLMEASDPMDDRRWHRKMLTVAHLLAHSDDPAPLEAEHTPGCRRRGHEPMQTHYIVRRPAAHGGTFVEVSQEWGTDAWDVRDVSEAEARAVYVMPSPQNVSHQTLAAELRRRMEGLIATVLQPGADDRRLRSPEEVRRDVLEAIEVYILYPDLPMGDDERT